MALRVLFFMLASFLIVTTRVSSYNEELLTEAAYAKVPVVAPVQSPLKAPPPAHVPVKAPAPPVKPPTPPVKAPTPPVKPPTPPVKASAPSPAKRRPRTRIECIPLCAERCKLHSRKNLCLRACVTCCDRCKCVPPGHYGNHEKCKCYAEMTTRNGKRKCP